MVENNKYGWDHAPNGKWHPVGEWTDIPENEFKKLKKKARQEYEAEKAKFERDRKTYNQLLHDAAIDPTRWWKCRPDFYKLNAGEHFRVWVENLPISGTLSDLEIQNLYQFPKGEGVIQALATGSRFFGGRAYHSPQDWHWRVQLYGVNGELRIARLRAFPELPSRMIDSHDYEKKQAVATAIAAESPNGVYILRIKDNKHITSKKNGRRYLLLEIEVLDGQARGYVGALFFDEQQPYALDRLKEIECALDIEHDLWKKMEDARCVYMSKDPKRLVWPYIKAQLDFSNDYLKLDNPSKVNEQEVNLWR